MNLSPIVLFVYNRSWHTRQTVEALQKNELAAESELFIFSDGPKNDAAEEKVREVRSYIRSINGFKNITIIEREKNWGLADNIIDGVTQVVNEYGRVIVLEDDIIAHPGMIAYFNRLLDFYENYSNVFSISAYCPPKIVMPIPANYDYGVYANPCMQCWGWATWKDCWSKADFSMRNFKNFNTSVSCVTAYAYWIGKESLKTLRACYEGRKDVWACRWVFAHFKYHAVCMCPTKSLIKNIGFDGSGVNCGKNNLYNFEFIDVSIKKIKLPEIIFVDPRIHDAYQKMINRSLFWRIRIHFTNIVSTIIVKIFKK